MAAERPSWGASMAVLAVLAVRCGVWDQPCPAPTPGFAIQFCTCGPSRSYTVNAGVPWIDTQSVCTCHGKIGASKRLVTTRFRYQITGHPPLKTT